MLKVNGAWMVYYDEYTRKRYGAIRSRDLKTWETVAVTFPAGRGPGRRSRCLRTSRRACGEDGMSLPRRPATSA